jgi:citrate lyase subunit beta/citryl-CoA lyase
MNATERLKEQPPRTWLFVPALKAPQWLPKAIASGADGIIVDLEDATAPSEKERARDVVRGLDLAPRERPRIVVRVNPSPPEVEEDCAAAVASGAEAIILPKVEGPFQVRRAAMLLAEAEKGRALAVMPMIETARAVLVALQIAEADERVAALCFGGGDLAAEMGAVRTREGAEIAPARAMVVLAAASRRLGSVDTPWLDIKDVAGAREEARHVARMGFTGKFVIHPSHVAAVNEAFTPSVEEVADARGLVDAFDKAIAAGLGIGTYKGRMIDKPDALQARRVLARADLARASVGSPA